MHYGHHTELLSDVAAEVRKSLVSAAFAETAGITASVPLKPPAANELNAAVDSTPIAKAAQVQVNALAALLEELTRNATAAQKSVDFARDAMVTAANEWHANFTANLSTAKVKKFTKLETEKVTWDRLNDAARAAAAAALEVRTMLLEAWIAARCPPPPPSKLPPLFPLPPALPSGWQASVVLGPPNAALYESAFTSRLAQARGGVEAQPRVAVHAGFLGVDVEGATNGLQQSIKETGRVLEAPVSRALPGTAAVGPSPQAAASRAGRGLGAAASRATLARGAASSDAEPSLAGLDPSATAFAGSPEPDLESP
jgi:hypothetical protein